MSFKNILVPFDGSKCSLRAFKIATEISKEYNSKLAVVTVITKSYHTSSLYANIKYEKILRKKQSDWANNALSKLDSIAKKKGINLTKYVLESNSVVKQIVSFAKSEKFDLIVMGSHGRTGLDRLLLGSVANGVSQKAGCSVLLIK